MCLVPDPGRMSWGWDKMGWAKTGWDKMGMTSQDGMMIRDLRKMILYRKYQASNVVMDVSSGNTRFIGQGMMLGGRFGVGWNYNGGSCVWVSE